MTTWSAITALTLSITVVLPPRGTGFMTPLLARLVLITLPWVGRHWWYWAPAQLPPGVLGHPLLDLDNHHVLHL